MNRMNKKGLLLLGGMLAMVSLYAGCGTDTKGAAPAVTEKISVETGTDANVDGMAEKRTLYEELMRENTSLWNSYNEVLQEVAYYDTLQQQEVAKETTYVSAEDKLNQTREENPLRFRVEESFPSEPETEEVIPEIPDEELDTWISDLTEQNQAISEQLSLLTPRRDALKARYGVGAE